MCKSDNCKKGFLGVDVGVNNVHTSDQKDDEANPIFMHDEVAWMMKHDEVAQTMKHDEVAWMMNHDEVVQMMKHDEVVKKKIYCCHHQQYSMVWSIFFNVSVSSANATINIG